MDIWTFIPQWFIDSRVYHHLYYKHTAEYKKDVQDVYDGVMAVRMRIIGK